MSFIDKLRKYEQQQNDDFGRTIGTGLITIKDAEKAASEFLVEDKHEYILCAAIWFDNGVPYPHQPKNIISGLVFCGWRHGCIFPQIGGSVKERHNLGIFEKEQGFLTNLNRFVNREEAMQIAVTAGQFINTSHRWDLYSEDLY